MKRAQEEKVKQELMKHRINQNILYRVAKARVDELTRELESLEQRQVDMGSLEVFEAKLLKLNQERDSFLSEVFIIILLVVLHSSTVASFYLLL